MPSAGHLWDVVQRKGLIYRSYGAYAARTSTGGMMEAAPGAVGLVGHVAKDYGGSRERDADNVAVFLREFKEYENNYDSDDTNKRFPNFVVMRMGEDHAHGTEPGAYPSQAAVANNDYAIGQLVEAASHSRYRPNTAIFIIEDDAQDGPDHVDARRTVGLVISPHVKRGIVDFARLWMLETRPAIKFLERNNQAQVADNRPQPGPMLSILEEQIPRSVARVAVYFADGAGVSMRGSISSRVAAL